MRTRFINAKILTMKSLDIFEGELWVNDDTIEYVGSKTESNEKFDKIIDCKGNVLMPSFKNAHTHSAMTFSRSLADNLPLDVWLNTKIFPMEAKLSPEHVYWFSKLAILEYLKCGTTAAFDMYFHVDSAAKASDESGFKFTFVSGMNNFGGFETLEENYLKFNQYSDLVLVSVFFPAEYTTSMELMKALSELSHKYEEPIFAHNSETKLEVAGCIERYGKTPTELMDELGLFDFGGGGFHCVHMSDNDYEIFKNRNLLAVTNPCSNLKLSSGIADIKRFVDMVKNQICGDMNIAGIGAAQATASGKVADSAKIGRNASTIALIQDKTPEEVEADGVECGNKKLRICLNRNGAQMPPDEYIDLSFNGNVISYEEAKQHIPVTPY